MKGGLNVADAFQQCKQSVTTFLMSPLTFSIQHLFLKMANALLSTTMKI